MFLRNKKNKKGSALAYALIITAVVSIILVSILQYISAQLKYSFNQSDQEEAFQVAEAGIYWYRWYLAHQVSGKTVQQLVDFWQSGNPYGVNSPYQADYYDPSGGKLGTYKIEVTKPDINSTIVMVKSTGWTAKNPNVQRIIQARFRRPSWSEYAALANDFMRFGAGTSVYGKVLSNAGVRFDGTAYNVVSSAVDQFDDPDHSGGNEFGVHTHVNAPPGSGINDSFRSLEAPPNPVPNRTDVFKAGRQFPVPAVDFNGVVSDLNLMKTQAQSGANGQYFDKSGGGRQIFLKTDGTYDVCTVNTYDPASYNITDYSGVVTGATGAYSGTNGSACTVAACCAGNACPYVQSNKTSKGRCVSIKNYNISNNGLIFVENNAWVEGTINNKKVTIVAANLTGAGSEANIYIGFNNLLYTNLNGADIIGLIAQNNLSVVRDSQNTLTIDAALLAKDGRVGRDYYSSAYNKNTITINGSIATNLRYGFAYTDGTGYANRILNFDNNLLYYPPPFFPTGTQYAIDLWDELR